MRERIRQRLASPALIVAVVALVAALGGAAAAQPSAKKVTTKKVKKIADKEIAKKAPGLSVAHADTADAATTATTADSANALQGQSLANVAVARSTNPGGQCDPNSSTFTVCATVNMTLPHEGRVLLIGTAGEISIDNSNSSGTCLFQVDGTNSGGAVLVGNAPPPGLTIVAARGFPNGFANTVVTDPVSAGPHTFALACDESDADVEFEGPQLSAALVGSG